MFSKVSLLVLGLSAMVVLISTNGEARDLAETTPVSKKTEVVKEHNDVSDLKYGTKTCTQGSGDENTDCFLFPGTPGFPGIPGFPFPGTPGLPAKVVKEHNDVSDLKYKTKACIQGSGDESSDCFLFPGTPGFPGIPGFPFPGTPGMPAEIVKEHKYVNDLKYETKACTQGSADESSDCFLFPGTPGFPGIPGFPFPGTPGKPAEVVKEHNDVSDLKYGSKACTQGSGDESSDCFLFPGTPGFPGIPGFPFPGTPGKPAEVVKEHNDVSDLKYGTKACTQESGDESSDCFLLPGTPGFPCIPGLPCPGTPGTL